MLQNPTDYNPIPAIMANRGNVDRTSLALSRATYTTAFYDFVRKELFLGGITFETDSEFEEALVLLFNMDII